MEVTVMAEPILTVDHLVKSYDGKTNVLDKVQPAGAVVIVSYPRIEGATGLPARVWAITE
jgi:hypothetical protein